MLTDNQLSQLESDLSACKGVVHQGLLDNQKQLTLYSQVEDFFKTSAYTLTTSKRGFNISIECIQLAFVEMLEFEEELGYHGFAVKQIGQDYMFKMAFCCSDQVKNTFMEKIKRLNSLDEQEKKDMHLNILGSSTFRSLIPGFTVLAISKKSSDAVRFHFTPLPKHKHLMTVFATLKNEL